MEHLEGLTNVCLSGGAEGADLQWGMYADTIGHEVIHWSFKGHHSRALESQLVRLDDEQLQVGVGALKDAADTLGKSLPQRPAVARLLQRNYYQVAWSTACYAIAIVEAGVVQGGTGWAVTMFTQLHPDNHNVYIFDQNKNVWFQVKHEVWEQIDSPPRPTGIWAGIGTRTLTDNGRDAIKRLMSRP